MTATQLAKSWTQFARMTLGTVSVLVDAPCINVTVAQDHSSEMGSMVVTISWECGRVLQREYRFDGAVFRRKVDTMRAWGLVMADVREWLGSESVLR